LAGTLKHAGGTLANTGRNEVINKVDDLKEESEVSLQKS
jgi:hypothetical protein